MRTVNKGCLQKPKSQTYPSDKAFYRPHTIVKSAIRQQGCYSQFGDELIIARESGRKLAEWLKLEEQAIDRRYNITKLIWTA